MGTRFEKIDVRGTPGYRRIECTDHVGDEACEHLHAQVDAALSLNEAEIREATHRIIEFVDAIDTSEEGKYAALLVATYAQKHFMLEHSEILAAAVPIVERLHEETMESLRDVDAP